eukprot:6214106-Pleurochrysis_carterae.AAC.1
MVTAESYATAPSTHTTAGANDCSKYEQVSRGQMTALVGGSTRRHNRRGSKAGSSLSSAEWDWEQQECSLVSIELRQLRTRALR